MKVKTVGALVATTAFGSGKVFSTAGQFVFIFQGGFAYFGIVNDKIIVPSLVTAAVTTGYIRGITRFPALWQFFSNKQQSGINLWQGNTPAEKANFIVMGSLSTIAALADGFQAYLGSDTMLEVLGISEWLTQNLGEEAGELTVIGFNTFLASSCALAYLAFFSKKSVQNSIMLQKQLQVARLTEENRGTVIPAILKTFLTSSLAGISYVAFAYYSVSASLELIWPSIPRSLVTATCSTVGVSVLATFLLSRSGETYKYFTSKETPLIKTYCNGIESAKDKAIVAPHWIIGFADIVVFMLASYFSFLGMFAAFSIKDNLWVEILPILACLSVGFMHYVFSLRPVIKKCIENRESYHAVSSDESSSQRTCFAKYLPSFSLWCGKKEPLEERVLLLEESQEEKTSTQYSINQMK